MSALSHASGHACDGRLHGGPGQEDEFYGITSILPEGDEPGIAASAQRSLQGYTAAMRNVT